MQPLSDAVRWDREETEYDYLLTRVRLRPELRARSRSSSAAENEPAAAPLGRVEERRVQTRVGYRVVDASRVRLLHADDGSVVAEHPRALSLLVRDGALNIAGHAAIQPAAVLAGGATAGSGTGGTVGAGAVGAGTYG
jgi:hypothetical protein